MGGATRIVTATSCATEMALVFCAEGERVVGGGAANGDQAGCSNISGFTDRNGVWIGPSFSATGPFTYGTLQGWAAAGNHLANPGDNLQVWAICQKL